MQETVFTRLMIQVVTGGQVDIMLLSVQYTADMTHIRMSNVFKIV